MKKVRIPWKMEIFEGQGDCDIDWYEPVNWNHWDRKSAPNPRWKQYQHLAPHQFLQQVIWEVEEDEHEDCSSLSEFFALVEGSGEHGVVVRPIMCYRHSGEVLYVGARKVCNFDSGLWGVTWATLEDSRHLLTEEETQTWLDQGAVPPAADEKVGEWLKARVDLWSQVRDGSACHKAKLSSPFSDESSEIHFVQEGHLSSFLQDGENLRELFEEVAQFEGPELEDPKVVLNVYGETKTLLPRKYWAYSRTSPTRPELCQVTYRGDLILEGTPAVVASLTESAVVRAAIEQELP